MSLLSGVMARPLRIEYEGAHYHVTSRGNERKAIFKNNDDREMFLNFLARAVEQFDIRLHAYVLMGNHYHLLIEMRRVGLNRALRYLNGVYTQAFNRRHKRVGHLFQGRYKAILVEKESYLLELSRYIHLNPWRVKRSSDPFNYAWSSLAAYTGSRAAPSWLTVNEITSQFGSTGKKGYRDFIKSGMKEGIRSPWGEVRAQAVIGSAGFIEEVRKRLIRGKSKEITRRRELVGTKPEVIMAAVTKHYGIRPEEIKGRGQRYTEPRYVASYLLRRYGLMGLREIGGIVGLHFSAVGNAVNRVATNPTRQITHALREIEGRFKNQET